MRMSGVYQPAIIKTLLESNGACSVNELAQSLVKYDSGIIEYYKKIVMRYPKQTLSKHGLIEYDSKSKTISLKSGLLDYSEKQKAIDLCDSKIAEWFDSCKEDNEPNASPSLRYEILKLAKGKCELCGISSSLAPLDIDHIVPRSKAKNGRVIKDGKSISLNSTENLQALCFRCNRAKRDSDDTDFRKTKKLVRDNIPAMIQAEGRRPNIVEIRGQKLWQELLEKLIEEHSEFIENKDIAELADMIEVIFALAAHKGVSEVELLSIAKEKKQKNGGFAKGYYYLGDN